MTTADEPTPPEEAQPEKPAKARSGVGGILREATIVIVGALIAVPVVAVLNAVGHHLLQDPPPTLTDKEVALVERQQE